MRLWLVLFAALSCLSACSADDFNRNNKLHEQDPGAGAAKVPPSARGTLF